MGWKGCGAGEATLRRLLKLDDLSDEIARELVSPLFRHPATIMFGIVVSIVFGVAGFALSGKAVYLAGIGYALVIMVWRLRQAMAFARQAGTGDTREWAVRSLKAGVAMGFGWSWWSALLTVESDPGLTAVLFGSHAAFVFGAAVLHHSVPLIARTQVLLGAVPLMVACLIVPNPFYHLYAAVLLGQICAAFSLIKALHRATVRALSNEVQALELSTKLATANEELELVNQHLKQQVATDPLTGLLNRRALDLAASREWRAALREGRPLSIVMVDVDHFKSYNDCYGHQAGDLCLRNVADVLGSVLRRPGDLLARFGGEEFIAILPSTYADGAKTVADRVLEALERRDLPHAVSPLGRISVSIGVASVVVTPSLSLADLIERADEALYDAKRAGRCRVHVHWHDPAADTLQTTEDDQLDDMFLFKPAETGVAD